MSNERHTSVGDLTGIPTSSSVAKIGHGRSDLAERLDGRSISRTLVSRHSNGFQVALGVLDLGRDRHDFVIEPASLLRKFRSCKRLVGICVLVQSGDVKILSNVLRGLDHRLHAVGGILAT